jgi:hypothetical protein
VAVLLVLPGALLVLSAQGQDLLRTVADGVARGAGLRDRTFLWLLAAALILGLQAWFWTRWIVEWRFGPRSDWPRSRYIVATPRGLGVAPFAIVAAGFAVIGTSDLRLWALLLLGAAFLGFVVCRSSIEGRVRGLASRLSDPRPAASGALFASLRLTHYAVQLGSVLLALAGLAVAVAQPVGPAQFFGPAAVALLALALIIPIVTPAIVLGKSNGVATVPALFAMALLFSLWDDNHHVRVTAACPADGGACGRPGVAAAFRKWEAALPADEPAIVPIIFVASQGGASRAGYWTADAMALLEERTGGRFSQHVFAISSVSGGTLGAAAFLAAIHDEPGLAARGALRQRVQDFVAQDYLSPALGGLLFPDLVQRFIPAPVLPDRGTALERGWEAGWRKICIQTKDTACRAGRMGRDFLALWRDPGPAWLPILMVGGATQETGRLLVTSSVDTGPWTPQALPRDPATVVEAGDFHRVTHRDVRLSTAILNGARFPYISPAGTLEDGVGQHIVDGGYFDAAGVEAARQLAAGLFGASRPAGARRLRLKPVYLLLLNGDPPASAKNAPSSEAPKANTFAQDLWGPLRGLYHARGAHGERLVASLDEAPPVSWDAPSAKADTAPVVIRLRVCHRLAMDWALSPQMTRTLRSDLIRDQPGCPNATALNQLSALLAAPPGR